MKFVLRTVPNTEKKGKWYLLSSSSSRVSLNSTYTVEAAPPPRACVEYAFQTISWLVSWPDSWVGSRLSGDRQPHLYRKLLLLPVSTYLAILRPLFWTPQGPTGKCHECVREPIVICRQVLEYRVIVTVSFCIMNQALGCAPYNLENYCLLSVVVQCCIRPSNRSCFWSGVFPGIDAGGRVGLT